MLYRRPTYQFLSVCYALSHCIMSSCVKLVKLQNVYLVFMLTMLNSVCWTATNDVHGFHGTHHSAATPDECKRICISNTLCKAIDWEWRSVYGETCWILTSTTTGPTTHNGTITHYELTRDCHTSVTS